VPNQNSKLKPIRMKYFLPLLLLISNVFGQVSRPELKSCPTSQVHKLQESDSGHLLIKVEVDKNEGIFAVDTGAQATVISEAFVNKVGLEKTPRKAKINGRLQTVNFVKYKQMKIGKIEVTCKSTLAYNLQQINRKLKNKIDGIIGLDILGQLSFEIDVRNESLTFFKKSIIKKKTKNCVPAKFNNNKIFITTVANGHKIENMLMDSGSSRTILLPKVLDKLNLDPSKIRPADGESTGVTNVAKNSQLVDLDSLLIGPHSIKPLTVKSSTIHHNSILGLDVYSRFKVRVDPFTKLVEFIK